MSESTAFLHRKHIKKHQKHPRYLLNPTILSGTLNSSVITALKQKKRKKTPSNNHYKEQFGRNYIPAMEPGLRTGILQTQVRAHHSQNHLFWKGPLMATQFLLCWIHFQSISGILNGADGRSSFCRSCSRQI